MYWTLELASKLEDAPWPATKDELIDYAIRSGAPLEVIENLQEIEDEGELCQCRRHKRHTFGPLSREDPLEEGTATHSNILAWTIPWKEEPGGLQTMGSQRTGHD